MAIPENLPFARGSTYFGMPGGATIPTLDDTSALNLVGREYIVQDNTYGTGQIVKIRIVRNDAGITLQPSRLVKFGPAPTAYNLGGNTTAGNLGGANAIGYANVGSTATQGPEKTAVVDEFLKYNVPLYDLFYVVVKGPCLAYLSNATADFADANTVAVGDYLHCCTAASSQAVSAGRIAVASFAGTVGSVIAAEVQNVVGRAMSGATSGQTGALLLIEAGFGFWE